MANLQPKRVNLFERTVAIFLLISFILLNVPYQAFAESLRGSSFSKRHGISPEDPVHLMDSLSLPEELGRIHETFIPNLRSNSANRLVIYLQGAHTNFDAESNIHKLIHFIKEKYELPLVLLEGGEGRLDSLFFKSFPDEEIKKKVLEDYLRNGELSGGEIASILQEGFDTEYFGIEDRALYRENKRAFLEALQRAQQVSAYLDSIESKLEAEAARIFPASLKIFHERQKAFREESLGLIQYLKSLEKLYGSKQPQFADAFPELHKILSMEADEKHYRGEKFEVAMGQFVKDFEQKILHKLSKREQIEMGRMIQDYRTGQLSVGELVKRIEGFSFPIPEILRSAARQTRTLSSIQGTKLFGELEALEKKLREHLPRSGEEKRLVNAFRQHELMKKLARLELSREEWEEISQSLRGNDPFFSPPLRFYELAVERDQVLFQNMVHRINQKKARLTVIVTGGFHTTGITQKLKDSGIPFVLVTPRINQAGDKTRYFNVMQNKTSYMRYFQGSLWDALAQDYTNKLVACLKGNQLPFSLKRWRDRIIQNALAEGKITQASSYTKYVDDITRTLGARHSEAGGRRISEILDQKLRAFENGLKEIWRSGNITAESVKNLFGRLDSISTSPLAVEIPLIRERRRLDFFTGASYGPFRRSEVRANENKSILPLDPQEIAISANGLAKVLVGGRAELLKKATTIFQFPEPKDFAGDRFPRFDIVFEKRQISFQQVWVFKKVDLEKFARVVDARIRTVTQNLEEDEIAISAPVLRKFFHVGGATWLQKFKEALHLPDPGSFPLNAFTQHKIEFNKRRVGGGKLVWAFKRSDLDKIALLTQSKIKLDISTLGADEIPISSSGLSQFFIGNASGLALLAKKKFELPNPKSIPDKQLDNQGITFYKRYVGTRLVWAVNQTDLTALARALNVTFHSPDVVPQVNEDERAISAKGIGLLFIGNPSDLIRDFKDKLNLPDPKASQKAVFETRGIVFHRRRSGTEFVWAAHKEDLNALSHILETPLRALTPELETDEMAMAYTELPKYFVGGPKDLRISVIEKFNLPNIRSFPQSTVTRAGVTFEKRLLGPSVVWAFKDKNKFKVAQHAGVYVRKDLPLLGEEEIAVSASIAEVFMGNLKALKQLKSQLPDPMAFGQDKFDLEGISFEKRKTKGGPIVWSFNKADKESVAELFGFRIRGLIPNLESDEVAVSGPGLRKIFVERKRKDPLKVLRSVLPDPASSQSDKVLLRGIEFKKRRVGVREIVWSFKNEDIEKVAWQFSFTLRQELEAQREETAARAEQIRQGMNALYQRRDDFEETIDITPLFEGKNLKQGLIPADFPLPSGRVWGEKDREIQAGKYLSRVEAVIKRQKGKLTIEFIGYRSEARAKEKQGEKEKVIGKSSWFIDEETGERVLEWSEVAFLQRRSLSKEDRKRLEKEIDEEVRRFLKDEQILFLASRYSLDIKNLLWGIIGARLEGKYDRKKIEELINERILDLIDQRLMAEESQRFQKLAPTVELEGEATPPQVFDPELFGQEEISTIAKNIDERLKELETRKAIDRALLEIARKQAIVFLKKLEERYFFKKYYSAEPDKFVGQRAKQAVEEILQKEPPSLVQAVLKELLKEMEEAIEIQDLLHQGGLRASTYLNLYQLIAVAWMVKGKKFILADEMGLGKTLEALSTFFLSDAREMLVMAPKMGLRRWMEDLVKHTDADLDIIFVTDETPLDSLFFKERIQIERFRKAKDRYEYLLSGRGPPPAGRKRIILTNYELLPHFDAYRKRLQRPPPRTDFIVLDEAHLLKNLGTKTSRAVFGDENGENPIEAEYKLVMTGTPLENKPGDLLGFLRYLAKGGSSEAEHLFAAIDPGRFSRIFRESDIAKLSQLHAYVAERMIRRLKEDVTTGLPLKKFVTVKLDPFRGTMTLGGEDPVSLPGDYLRQAELYETALQSPQEFERRMVHRVPLEEDVEEEADGEEMRTTQILRLEQVAIDPGIFGEEADAIKYDAARKIIEERIKSGKSVLVFTNFRTVASRFRHSIERDHPGQIAYVDGLIQGELRAQEVARFQDKKARLMDATTATMGLAVELTQADTVLWINYPWKPSTFNQGIDRAHRYDPMRNYKGKVLEIITLELDLPLSIDVLKRRVLKRKEILSEMIVNGNLTPELLAAFSETEESIAEALEEGAISPASFDPYELSLVELFRLKLGEILHTKDPQRRQTLWGEIAVFYREILEHKASFFANMASLDHLSGPAYAELKGKEPKKVLDLGSGPSTLYLAYERKRRTFERKNFHLDITDYDLSPQMLRLGVPRPERQILGSFEGLGHLPANQYDIANLSYAFRYTQHPAQLIQNVYRILKDQGLFVVILPKNNLIPPKFYEALREAGFDLRTGKGAHLESRLDPDTYQELLRRYGREFADDMAGQVQGDFVYLVAKKDPRRVVSQTLRDEDFTLISEMPPINEEKIERLKQSGGEFKMVPESTEVTGKVTYPTDLLESKLEAQQRARSQRRILRHMKRLEPLIVSYLQSSERNREKRARWEKEIEERFETLRDEIFKYADQYPPQDRAELLEEFKRFQERDFVRRWLRQGRQALMDALIKRLSEKEPPGGERSEVRAQHRFSAEEGRKRVLDYLKALKEGRDLTPVTRNLIPFEMKAMKKRIYFGKVAGRGAVIGIAALDKGDPVKITPILIDETDPSQGAYLKAEAKGQVWHYHFKKEPSYFELPPRTSGIQEILDYLEALQEGMDLTKVTRNLIPFEMKAIKKGIYFGKVAGKYAVIGIAALDKGDFVKITPILIDKKDPSQGAYLKVEAKGKVWYYHFKKESTYFVQIERISQERLKKREILKSHIASLYQRKGDFKSITIDITDLFKLEDLKQGLLPQDFPLPGGKTPGSEKREMHAGKNLRRVELTISRKNGKLKFEFTGYRRSEVRAKSRFLSAEEGKKRILDYIEALLNGEDLTSVTQALNPFEIKAVKKAIYFGVIAGKVAVIGLKALSQGDSVRITPLLIDAEDPSQGTYLKIEAKGKTWYYGFKKEPNYFEYRASPGPQEILDYIQSLQEGKNLTKVTQNLKSFQMKAGMGKIYFGRIAGEYASISLHTLSKGDLVQITPVSIDKKNPSRGAYLEVKAKGQTWYYRFKREPGYFEYQTYPGPQSILDYIKALQEAEDLTEATQNLIPFQMEARRKKIYFGTIAGKAAQIKLETLSKGYPVQITPVLIDKKDPSQGAYLKVESKSQTWNYNFKNKPHYFESLAPPGIQEILDYIKALQEAKDLTEATQSLKPFQMTAMKKKIYFGWIARKSAEIGLETLSKGDLVHITPILIDEKDPSRGAYLKLEAKGQFWYYDFKKEPSYFVQINLAKEKKRTALISQIKMFYERKEDFEEQLDITALFSPLDLKQGLLSEDFPLPRGRTQGSENREMHAGKNLRRVELTISRKNGKLKFEFTGLRRSEARQEANRLAAERIGAALADRIVVDFNLVPSAGIVLAEPALLVPSFQTLYQSGIQVEEAFTLIKPVVEERVRETWEERNLDRAKGLLETVQALYEETVIEYRVPKELSVSDNLILFQELLETVRNAVVLKPILSVRILVASREDKKTLDRILGRMTNKETAQAMRRISIVGEEGREFLIDFHRPATIAITNEPLQALNGLKALSAFDSAKYADKSPILFTEGVTPSELFLATLASLSEKTVEGLHKYENGLVQAQNQASLSPFTLLVHMIAREAEAEIEAAHSA